MSKYPITGHHEAAVTAAAALNEGERLEAEAAALREALEAVQDPVAKAAIQEQLAARRGRLAELEAKRARQQAYDELNATGEAVRAPDGSPVRVIPNVKTMSQAQKAAYLRRHGPEAWAQLVQRSLTR